jgi:hypothetical protein
MRNVTNRITFLSKRNLDSKGNWRESYQAPKKAENPQSKEFWFVNVRGRCLTNAVPVFQRRQFQK